jgi:hypothetical protein
MLDHLRLLQAFCGAGTVVAAAAGDGGAAGGGDGGGNCRSRIKARPYSRQLYSGSSVDGTRHCRGWQAPTWLAVVFRGVQPTDSSSEETKKSRGGGVSAPDRARRKAQGCLYATVALLSSRAPLTLSIHEPNALRLEDG